MINYNADEMDLLFTASVIVDMRCRIISMNTRFPSDFYRHPLKGPLLDRFACDIADYDDQLVKAVLNGRLMTFTCRWTGLRLTGVGLPCNGDIYLALNPATDVPASQGRAVGPPVQSLRKRLGELLFWPWAGWSL